MEEDMESQPIAHRIAEGHDRERGLAAVLVEATIERLNKAKIPVSETTIKEELLKTGLDAKTVNTIWDKMNGKEDK